MRSTVIRAVSMATSVAVPGPMPAAWRRSFSGVQSAWRRWLDGMWSRSVVCCRFDEVRACAATRAPRWKISTVLAVILVVWYAAAVWLNAPQVRERLDRVGEPYGFAQVVDGAWAMDRPVLPAPHQIAMELHDTVIDKKVTSKRSLVHHAWVTMSATLAGFALGLALGAQLTIVLTAVLASIGTAAVPSAGIVMLVIILEAIEIPAAGIALILGVDRPLDMLRTVNNVTGDAMVATVVAATEDELGAPVEDASITSQSGLNVQDALEEAPHSV